MTRRLLFLALLLSFCSMASLRALTLNVWDFPRIQDPGDKYDRFAWLRRMLRSFEAENPGVKVQLTELTWKQGQDKLKIAVYAGAAPDVTSGALSPGFVDQGVIEPVDAFLDASDLADYYPGALAAFRMGGKTWGFPWCSKTDALYVNLELFRKAGATVPADGRWTWASYEEACRKLRTLGEKSYGLGSCLVPERTAEYAFLLSGGGSLIDGKGKLDLFRGPARKGVDWFLGRLAAGDMAPPDAGGATNRDVWLSFVEHRTVASAPFGLWALAYLKKKQPFDFALTHMPHGPGVDPVAMTATTGYFVFKQKDPKRRAAAMKLARFITNAENQKILALYGQFPTRRATGSLYPGDPHMSRAAEIATFGRPVPLHSAWGRIDDLIKRGLQRVVLGERSLEDTAEETRVEANRLLAAAPARRTGSPELPDWVWIVSTLAAFLAVGLGVLMARRPGGKGVGWRRDRWAWAFVLPSVILFAIFLGLPILRAIALAFQNYTPGQPFWGGWVGFENFRRVLGDRAFMDALVNTGIYTATVVPLNVLVGLVLASLIHPLSARWRTFFRGAFYLPGIASVVVLAIVWRWLYDDRHGAINAVLSWKDGAVFGGPARIVTAFMARLDVFVAHTACLLGGFVLLHLAVTFLTRRKAPWTRASARSLLAKIGICAAAVVVFDGLWQLPWGGFFQGGWSPIRWLKSTDLSLPSIILATLVRGPGGALIIYLSAMGSIGKDLYEAAEIDGANAFQRWYNVTVPLLAPTTLFLMMTMTIDSFQVFAQVLMLTDGGPGTSSTVLVHKIYTSAFRDLDFGGASAMALVLFAMIATVSVIQFKFFSQKDPA